MSQIEENIINLLANCGRMTEAEIREELGISHGTFFAAKKALLAGGAVTAAQEGKKLYYAAQTASQEAREPSAGGRAAMVKPAPAVATQTARALYVAPNFEQSEEATRMTKVTGTFETVGQFEDALSDELGNVTVSGDPASGFTVICHDHDGYRQRYDSCLEDDNSFTVF